MRFEGIIREGRGVFRLGSLCEAILVLLPKGLFFGRTKAGGFTFMLTTTYSFQRGTYCEAEMETSPILALDEVAAVACRLAPLCRYFIRRLTDLPV